MSLPADISSAAGVIGALGGVAYIGAFISPPFRARRARKRAAEADLQRMFSDWKGTEARPGFPAVPGVPERLEAVEHTVTTMSGQLADIHAELHPNSGSTLRDQVDAIRAALTDKPAKGNTAAHPDQPGAHQL